MAPQTKPGAKLLDQLAEQVEKAQASKKASASPEKVARDRARSLLAAMGGIKDTPDALTKNAEAIVKHYESKAPDAFDKKSGNDLYVTVRSVLDIPPALRPAGFDTERANKLLSEWSVFRGGRPPRETPKAA